MLNAVLGLLSGYLLGAVPSAFLVSKLKKRDVFEVGSGNMGTMNVARNLGVGLGVVVLLMDLGKGVLASYVGLALSGDTLLPAYAASLGAVLGHTFSLFVGFRGGKGLATALGVALPLYPLEGLLALAVLVVLILLLRKRSNLAAMLLTALYPLIVWLSLRWQAKNEPLLLLGVLLIAAIVFVKHIPSVRTELSG